MMESRYFWSSVFLLALGTIVIRFSIIGMSSKIKINDRVKELFSYIPSAILPAFIAPAVFFDQGHVSLLFGKERLVVLFFASMVCFVTRSTLATIGMGLIVLYLVSLIG
ncbi:MAG: AzlD domain-containing protein [Bdellovibrionaceae bacterium]|nr:AzlD domain-containing protein [Pseudobdellovibrionaceae bacterium]